MNTQLLIAKFVRSLRRNGLRSTLREGFRLRKAGRKAGRITDEFDLKYGTDTGGTLQLWNLTISSPNARFGNPYQPINEQAIVDAIRVLPDDPHALTFIDLGCGKGRALLIAANLGFKQVVGVEFAYELVEIARKNMEKMGIANAVVLEADAAEFHFPNDDMVVYLYNSFYPEVIQKVIANLRESLAKKLYVIYANPKCAALFDTSGFLTRLDYPTGKAGIQIWTAATPS